MPVFAFTMNDFDFSKPVPVGPSRAEAARRVKGWVESLAVLGSECVVSVAELECHDPDCPDCETVISLMYSRPSETRTVKIFKPLHDVTQDEVLHAVLKSFADGPPAIAAIKAELVRTPRANACG
jgi:hypothetical protein